ncbi:MAG: transglycosylase domain-containing protein [Clostridia bacterium]|nr:transglycosylase domain-containing protein [Clostridia bacterium]
MTGKKNNKKRTKKNNRHQIINQQQREKQKITQKTSSKQTTQEKSKKQAIGKKRNKKVIVPDENTKALKKVKKQKFKERHPKLSLAIRIILLLLIVFIVIATGIVIGIIYGAFGDDFKISLDELTIKTSNSLIVYEDGTVITELSGDENRQIITLDEMSPYLANAYVAIEDERFYDHNGVDLYRTGGAIFTYVTHAGNSSFGGSTITQQLVKNITKDDEDTGIEGALRKAKEWAKAYQVERMLSKEQILELYLNIIFIGGSDNHGVQTAAKYYFNKNASDLSLVECAFLAGINNGPNGYAPFGEKGYSSDEAKKKKIDNKTKVVLSKMYELGKISKEEYDEATKQVEEQGITFNKGTTTTTYSYHTDALINQAIEDIAEEKEISKSLAETYLYSSGLTIYSTEKQDVQQKTEKAINEGLVIKSTVNKDEDGNPVKNQSAMVVIDQKTGYVVACVGGVGEKDARGLNRATQSVRQPGSTIKPIADVGPGLEEKIITAATIYNDSATKFKVGNSSYEPKNYNYFRGNITIRQAIETSQNIPFVKEMTELGVGKSIEYLEKLGITTLSKENEGLALAIGGVYNGISPLEMAAAYATIANDGVYIEPTFYTKIVDSNGNVVLQKEQETHRVFSETTCAILKDILKEPVEGSQGTAKICKISGIDVAAKTGTTNADKDRWLCGFTNYYTAATWYGYDQPERIIYTSGVSPATRIWAAAMKDIHSGYEQSKFTLPSNVVTAKICKDSGKLATDSCTNTYTEIFEKGTVPESCEGHKGVKICNETHLLANEYCTDTSTIYKNFLVEKEKNGNWETPANSKETAIPTEYCTVHKKTEVKVEPQESDDKKTTVNVDTKENKDDKENKDNTATPSTTPNTNQNPSTTPNTNQGTNQNATPNANGDTKKNDNNTQSNNNDNKTNNQPSTPASSNEKTQQDNKTGTENKEQEKNT